MQVIHARNVNDAYRAGIKLISQHGEKVSTRAGECLRTPWPVTTVYGHPWERVLFDGVRDANPFFHLMESLWMLGGRNDVKWITQFNKSFKQFSDDGLTYHGAYGHRWRCHFGFDQIKSVIDQLKKSRETRRAYIAMWDPRADASGHALDHPCNVGVKFDIRNGYLNMYVFNRSNDIIWGAYGANAVHMSFLQEVVAAYVHCPIGGLWQISTDYHAYTEVFDQKRYYDPLEKDPYVGGMKTFAVVEDARCWFEDLDQFLLHGAATDRNPFFKRVAMPMRDAYLLRKHKDDIYKARIMDIAADDWRNACIQWVERRMK